MEFNYQQSKPIIRIKQIRLRNFKNVRDSKCQIITNKQNDNGEEGSYVLGLYGQNGSGKTAIIDAIHLLKYVMSGQQIPSRFADCISVNAEKANLEYTFSIQDPGLLEQKNTIVYSFDLLSERQPNQVQEMDTDERIGIRVRNEIVCFGGIFDDKAIKLQPIIRTDTSPMPIGPDRKLDALLGKKGKRRKLHRLSEIKQDAYSMSRSLLFSDDTLLLFCSCFPTPTASVFSKAFIEQVMVQRAKDTSPDDEIIAFIEDFIENGAAAVKRLSPSVREKIKKTGATVTPEQIKRFHDFYHGKLTIDIPEESFDVQGKKQHDEAWLGKCLYNVLLDLHSYASTSLYVVDTRTSGSIRLKQKLPLMTREHTFEIPLDGDFTLPKKSTEKLSDYISGVNAVLTQLVPNLGLVLDNDKSQLGDDSPLRILASRNGNLYPLRFESDGVIRLISLLWLLIPAFNDHTFTLAIDEIDAGIYEFLLGDILKAFEQYGKGQLVFTSHNLRPLEVLSKEAIVFTTTNPENRYIRLKRIGQTNNLRDVYLREIRMHENEEELYKAGKKHDFLSSIRNASLGYLP